MVRAAKGHKAPEWEEIAAVGCAVQVGWDGMLGCGMGWKVGWEAEWVMGWDGIKKVSTTMTTTVAQENIDY